MDTWGSYDLRCASRRKSELRDGFVSILGSERVGFQGTSLHDRVIHVVGSRRHRPAQQRDTIDGTLRATYPNLDVNCSMCVDVQERAVKGSSQGRSLWPLRHTKTPRMAIVFHLDDSGC